MEAAPLVEQHTLRTFEHEPALLCERCQHIIGDVHGRSELAVHRDHRVDTGDAMTSRQWTVVAFQGVQLRTQDRRRSAIADRGGVGVVECIRSRFTDALAARAVSPRTPCLLTRSVRGDMDRRGQQCPCVDVHEPKRICHTASGQRSCLGGERDRFDEHMA